MNEQQKLGYDLMYGACLLVGRWLLLGIFIVIGFQLLLNVFSINLDDSDNGPWGRSGMKIYTDHKTGVQYLSTRHGHLTPRITPSGEIVTK